MTDFVLVHGAWHGAWCWYRVAPALERLGHRVITPDLPGHGRDRNPPSSVSLQAYADRVAAAIDDPVILVGHSLGGMVISQVAADHPERVALLVYLAAFLPAPGQSLSNLVEGESESQLLPICVPNRAGDAIVLHEAGVRAALFHDCTDEDYALGARLIQPEPAAPLEQPLRADESRLGRVPRVYIECTEDRALPLARQRRMHSARPCRKVLALRAGHSPYFSAVDPLVEYLSRLWTT